MNQLETIIKIRLILQIYERYQRTIYKKKKDNISEKAIKQVNVQL